MMDTVARVNMWQRSSPGTRNRTPSDATACSSSQKPLSSNCLHSMQIILDAVDKPRVISFKGASDLVTETDKRSEDAIIKVTRVPWQLPCLRRAIL